jgi:hypothetical protein
VIGGETLLELLVHLEAEWTRLRAPVAARLRPGLREEEVRSRLATLGLDAPDDLVTFFGWHDGEDHSDGQQRPMLVDDLFLVTLDEAVELTRFQRELSGQVSEPPSFVLWPQSWALVCTGGGGQELALDCSSRHGVPYLKDRDQAAISDFDGDLLPRAASLAAVVAEWIAELSARGSC